LLTVWVKVEDVLLLQLVVLVVYAAITLWVPVVSVEVV
jgi:hypothetical protein